MASIVRSCASTAAPIADSPTPNCVSVRFQPFLASFHGSAESGFELPMFVREDFPKFNCVATVRVSY